VLTLELAVVMIACRAVSPFPIENQPALVIISDLHVD
jgi:hypothetical protein